MRYWKGCPECSGSGISYTFRGEIDHMNAHTCTNGRTRKPSRLAALESYVAEQAARTCEDPQCDAYDQFCGVCGTCKARALKAQMEVG